MNNFLKIFECSVFLRFNCNEIILKFGCSNWKIIKFSIFFFFKQFETINDTLNTKRQDNIIDTIKYFKTT